jgi:hypothetical protein
LPSKHEALSLNFTRTAKKAEHHFVFPSLFNREVLGAAAAVQGDSSSRSYTANRKQRILYRMATEPVTRTPREQPNSRFQTSCGCLYLRADAKFLSTAVLQQTLFQLRLCPTDCRESTMDFLQGERIFFQLGKSDMQAI